MNAPTHRNRVLFLLTVLITVLVMTGGLLNVMAAHAWLPDAPATDVGGGSTATQPGRWLAARMYLPAT